MNKITVNGSRRLEGIIELQGSKNSCLPILAACVAVGGVSVIHNCPNLSDVSAAVNILEYLGCKTSRTADVLTVDATCISRHSVPHSLMRQMRSSIVFLGSILTRMGAAVMSAPGGCEIGLRPIDLHLSSLRRLGAKIDECGGELSCSAAGGIKPTVISLSFPSVGATENIMLACIKAKGTTTILNAAGEPEIYDLAAFLNACGCSVEMRCEGTIVINGVSETHGCEHTVIADRIAALTYMAAVGGAGGDVFIRRAQPEHFIGAVSVFEQAGCTVKLYNDGVRIISSARLSAVSDIRTMPYPGFPTDAQAPVMAMLTVAKGTGIIVENIFESRFKHVPELIKMGAKIKVEGRVAIIDGVERLYGCPVEAVDLRAGSSLVIAGLSAVGQTVVHNAHHIYRGYDDIVGCLKAVGADIF